LIGGVCDHDFLPFSTIFTKNGVFLKNQCYDGFFARNWHKSRKMGENCQILAKVTKNWLKLVKIAENWIKSAKFGEIREYCDF
jgi:hypothetical protein